MCGRKNDKGRWGRRTREGAGYLPVRYFENTDSWLRAASFKMETAVTRSGSESTSQRLSLKGLTKGPVTVTQAGSTSARMLRINKAFEHKEGNIVLTVSIQDNTDL